MSSPTSSRRRVRRPLAILALTVLVAAATQVTNGSPAAEPTATGPTVVDVPAADIPTAATGDLERIRANVAFWSSRTEANPRDFISHTRLAAAEIDLARATGDVTRYVAAEAAVDAALAIDPDYRPAQGYRGAVLIALHEFPEARDHARAVLADTPGDPAALGTLADAALALGDMDTARGAVQELLLATAESAAARVRQGHLAFVDGDPDGAVTATRAAVQAAIDEGHEGVALAWFRSRLGEVLASTGDLPNAERAFEAALEDDPSSALARAGLARLAAARADWDAAIAHLDAAIAIVPSPEFVARRADLYAIRAADGDARRERDDRRTVLAIASLAGDAGRVYDRTLALYLAGPGADPARALELAEAEIAVRRDIYGYDALAWALHANGHPEEARAAMTEALALGTRDAKLLFHAGVIEARLGNHERARTLLQDALATDPSFDPLAVREARRLLEDLP
jgi:tetratricopeptide (TPR) repeat protein